MSFLKAEWKNLIIANYAVDCEILKKYVPHKTELDIWEGTCFVSLVGFKFQNTKILGMKIPFHIDFEEVNLRFYVRFKDKGEWKRGVVFIKELVPKCALTFVARTFYKENYQTVPMKHKWLETNDEIEIEYSWDFKEKSQKMRVSANPQAFEIPIESELEFITEHYWGYTKITESETYEYQVTHPRWRYYNINNFELDVDFGLVYGKDFAFLNDLEPKSIMLAEGSIITVENKRKI